MQNLKAIREQNPVKWAILMSLVSSFAIFVVAIIDANIDFNATSALKMTKSQIIFYLFAFYLFIKVFTFFRRFSFISLALFTLIFINVFMVLYGLFVDYFAIKITHIPHNEYDIMLQNATYGLMSALNLINIFVLNLIPHKFFNNRTRIKFLLLLMIAIFIVCLIGLG